MAPEPPDPPALPRRRRHWVLLAVVVASLLVSAGGLGASFLIKSPAERAAETAPPPKSLLTVPVESRTVTDTLVLRGQVTAAQSVTASPQSAGDTGEGTALAVVTAVRVKKGSAIRPAQVLAEVAGRPIFALPGPLPVYRDLKPGDRGKDVRQMQVALRGVGVGRGLDADGVFNSDTKDAVAALYRKIGYDAPLAGGTNNEELEAAEQAVRQAVRTYEQARDAAEDADSTTTEAGGDSGGAGGTTTGNAAQQLRYAREDLHRARDDLAKVEARTGPMLPAAEVIFLPSFPGRIDSVNATVGGAVEDDMLVVSVGKLLVTARLKPSEQGLVSPGQTVRIASEVLGVEASGRVETVAATPENEETDGGGTETFFPMRIAPTKPLDPRLAGQGVRLTVIAASTKGKVLAVPAAAVSARADGTTAVVRVRDDRQERVEVTVGTSGDGYVEIRPVGATIRPGDRVVVGQ